MNVVITGGNGYLGSNIAKKFLANNHSVCIFSRNTSNIKDILSQIKFFNTKDNNFVEEREIIKFEPELIIHCGWSGGNNYNDINSTSQFYNNIEPSIRLLEIINILPKKPKFIGIGSFSEYGILNSPATEVTLEKPINLYGLSKYTLKNYSEIICKQYNIDWVWVRPCFVYGPGDVKTRLIPKLINKFLNNQEVVLDECNTTIDYLYIEDFTNMLYELSLTNSVGVYNICSGHQYHLKEVINLLYNLVGSKSGITFDNNINRTSISNYICGDNSKIKTLIKYSHQISLKEGLLKTINFYINETIHNT